MQVINRCFLLLTVLFLSEEIKAQQSTLSGTLTDAESGEALIGATVIVDEKEGITTDINGNYKIKITTGTHEVEYGYLGYESKMFTILVESGESKELNVNLSSKTEQLRVVVVSASQYEKNIAEETVSMDVLDKELVNNTNSRDLGEAVYKTPGVQVQDGQIIIRGGGSYSYGVGSRTSVLVDGQSLMSADLGDAQLKLAPIENTEQVEIIKGSSSVIYGSAALNGVVNMRTIWPVKGEKVTNISTYAGLYHIPRKSLIWWDERTPHFSGILFNHMQKENNLGYVLGGNIDFINSYLELSDEFRIRLNFKTKYNLPKNNRINFGLNGNFMFEQSGRFFLARGLESYERFQGSKDRYIRTTVDPHFTYQNENGHRYTINMRYLNIFRKGNGTDRDVSSNSIELQNQYQYNKKRVVVTAGIPFTYGFSRSNLYLGYRLNFSVAAYIQAEYKSLNERLSVVGGARYEVIGVDSIVDYSLPVFRAGVNYRLGRASYLRGSIGQSYRLPAIGERFVSASFTAESYVIPNPDLRSEKGWSTEIGLKQGFIIGKWKGFFDFTIFYQNYTDFVEYRNEFFAVDSSGNILNRDGSIRINDALKTPLDTAVTKLFIFARPQTSGGGAIVGLVPKNVEQASIFGYEASIAGMGKLGPIETRILLGYTYTWPANLEEDSTANAGTFLSDAFSYMFSRVPEDLNYKVLQFRSRHTIRGDIELTYKKASLGYSLYYNSFPERIPELFVLVSEIILPEEEPTLNEYIQQHEKGDFVMDIRAAYRVNDKFKVSFIVKNLTNRVYSQRPAKLDPPRSYTLQFQITL